MERSFPLVGFTFLSWFYIAVLLESHSSDISLQSLFGKVLGRRTDVWRLEPELGLLLRPLFPGAIEIEARDPRECGDGRLTLLAAGVVAHYFCRLREGFEAT